MAADFQRVKYPYRRHSSARRAAIAIAAAIVLLVGADAANQRFDLTDFPAVIHWFVKEPPEEISQSLPIPSIFESMMDEHEFALAKETTVADTTPTQVEITPEPEPVVIPPQMKVGIIPPGLMQMRVDGQSRDINQYFETVPGQHEIVIEHGDYPIYRTYASVSSDTSNLEFDLRDRFTDLDSTNVILITLPRDDRYKFDLTCNGKTHEFKKTRNFDFYLQNGLWHVGAVMKPENADMATSPNVDSIVVGVVGKAITYVIKGSDGYMNVNSGPAGDQKMRLLIYWSETLQNAGR